ncbi:hypothetical protein [Rhizobium sp. RAF56]|uniref:hypothetical protein n=1 Tax=Rhizobium sp. RAF56 TaxID=3233062 RepID=UPI003F9901C0
MRRLSPILAATFVAGLALQGCAAPRLSERYVVPENDPGINRAQDNFALEPGDVVHIVTFLKGSPVPDTGVSPNFYPPFSEHIRLPIRHAQGELTADEANLLMGVLATDSAPPPIDASTQAELQKHRIELWNALIDSRALVLRKADGTKPSQLQIDMTRFCPAFHSAAGTGSVLSTTYLVDTCADSQNAPTREPRQIDALDRPLDAIGRKASNLHGGKGYYLKLSAVAVAVAQVERHGVAMKQAELEEGRWSLADWNAARICPGQAAEVALRTEPWRLLRIMPAGTSARYKVVATEPGLRTLTVDDRQATFETITYASLALLSPSDVATVRWGKEQRAGRPNAVVQLSASQRRICTP